MAVNVSLCVCLTLSEPTEIQRSGILLTANVVREHVVEDIGWDFQTCYVSLLFFTQTNASKCLK